MTKKKMLSTKSDKKINLNILIIINSIINDSIKNQKI